MPSESILRLKDYYENGPDNIGRDLIRPCLKECSLYRRGAAFFGSSTMVTYADALHHVIKDDVKIEILCSPVINDLRLLETYEKTLSEDHRVEIIQKFQEEIIYKATQYQKDPDNRKRLGSELLAYLIANGQLEIKTAIRKKDGWPDPWPEDADIENHSYLYHVKRGYFVFENDKKLSFCGSFNETFGSQQNHTEETQVYKNWLDADKRRGDRIIKNIDRDWNNENNELHIRPLSNELIQQIKESVKTNNDGVFIRPKNFADPNIPDSPNDFEIDKTNIASRQYQKDALNNWKDNNFIGILEMATGSGKTRTAIQAISDQFTKNNNSLIVVVVPKINLALQWIKELRSFSIDCKGAFTNQKWIEYLEQEIVNLAIQGSGYKLPIIVVVRDTFVSEKFKNILTRINDETKDTENLIIVDECHNFNKKTSIQHLPDFFKKRLGLSATPFNQFEEKNDESKFLLKYFDKIVFSFDLEDALNYNPPCLTPYIYKIIPVEINSDEIEVLEDINKRLGIAYRRLEDNYSSDNQRNVDILNSEKNRFLSSIKDKLTKLENLISKNKKSFSLAYCGDSADDDDGERKRHIEKVSKIFHSHNWRVGKITSDEDMYLREENIKSLENRLIDVIVSIRVLDEGIDIPCCENAYILASSKSNREFIQRRGRVLRQYKNKEFATIYDFVITSSEVISDSMTKVISDEFYRVYEFAKLAKNKEEIFDEYKTELSSYE